MKICFLGSSITRGLDNISFVEFLKDKYHFSYLKEAVNGTTMVEQDEESYIGRLKKIPLSENFDLFIVQLSTNDCNYDFTLKQIKDAIDFIISYVDKYFHCQVIFYTSAYYNNLKYKQMVELLQKMNCQIIDLYSDEKFNDLTIEERKKYMIDDIHPTILGYQKWWTPYFEKALKEILNGNK